MKDTTDPMENFEHSTVYSGDMRWVPVDEEQAERFKGRREPRPVHPDIIIAKLRPGQEIEFRAHCVKGIGHDHAKFSPVATASYRLLPTIELVKDEDGKDVRIAGEAAERFQESFSKGVVELVEDNGEKIVKIVDPRKDMCSRNIFRHADLKDSVFMGRKRDHFIYQVESVEAVKSTKLVIEACRVLQEKCANLLNVDCLKTL